MLQPRCMAAAHPCVAWCTTGSCSRLFVRPSSQPPWAIKSQTILPIKGTAATPLTCNYLPRPSQPRMLRTATLCLAVELLQQEGTATTASAALALPTALSPLTLSLAQSAQWLLTGVAAYVAAGWPERPRGWSRRDLLEVTKSSIEGLGVVARVPIPEGTVVGCYPGRPRQAPKMRAKIDMAPLAASYCFQTKPGWLLDPTDMAGRPTSRPSPGLPWLAVDATLCRVNEPPPGSAGPNVAVQDDPKDELGLLVVASRDIQAGEELWIDYGPVYDRSTYGVQQQGAQRQGQ